MKLTLSMLLPTLVGLICTGAMIGCLYYSNGSRISGVRLVIGLLWMGVIFGGTGYLLTKIDGQPYQFLTLFLVAILAGILYFVFAPRTLDWWHRTTLADVVITNFMLCSFGLSIFALVYVLISHSESNLYMMLAAFFGFVIPCPVVKAYDYWMLIPRKRFKTWVYPVQAEVPRLQPIEPIKLIMNFTPVPSGKNPVFEGYEVEFPTNEPLSALFHYFVNFHNKHREYRKNPIQYLEGNIPVEWVLYKYSAARKKQFLEMDKTLIENQIRPNEHIYAASSVDGSF